MGIFKRYLGKSELFKNVAVLVSGTAIAQAITLLISPVLTRLFTPEDFAVFAQFSAIVSIIGVVAAGRYEMAIVLPRSDSHAEELLFLCVLFSLLSFVVTFLVIIAYDFFFSNDPESYFTTWFYLAPLAVLLSGLYAAFNYWSSRQKTFYLNSAGRVGMALLNAAMSLFFGWLGYAFSGLILGFVLGQLLGVLIMSHKHLLNFLRDIGSLRFSHLKERGIEYKKFPMVNAPHALVDSIQDNGVVFVLSYYFLSPIVAFYAHAFRLLKAPVGLIGSAFYQVSYQKLSQMKNNHENVRPFILSMYKKMFLIGFPFFLPLFLFTPEIFAFVFGEKWLLSGEIAQILIPWIFINFIIAPISCVPLVYGKQAQAFYITIIDIVVRFSALILGGMLNDYKLSFIIISAFCSSLLIFALIWYYYIPLNNEVQKNN